jgi:hypothetical protein
MSAKKKQKTTACAQRGHFLTAPPITSDALTDPNATTEHDTDLTLELSQNDRTDKKPARNAGSSHKP